MQDIFFDSRHELDRLPTGAVTSETPVRLGVRVAEHLGIWELLLIVKNDDSADTAVHKMEPVWTEKGYTRFETVYTSGAPGLYWYWFTAKTPNGDRQIGKSRNSPVMTEGNPAPWQLTVYSPEFTTPDWIKGGVFYHIFVDRFKKGGNHPLREGAVTRSDWGGTPIYEYGASGVIENNDFFGGDLDGVIEKLPLLSELGVTCIYLSPIFEAASNHKYDTADYMKIDRSFGDEEGFRKLCSEAGELGIRVICDGVFNHTGDDSVYFDRYGRYGGNGAYNSKESPYYPWYSFTDWPDDYEAWWGIKTLPQVREDNPEYRKFVFGENGVLRHWLRCGASGWRLDVADELPDSFIQELRTTVKSEKLDALVLGEVWEDASTKLAYGRRRHYFEGAQLDSVMNYPFKNGIIDFLMSGNAEALGDTVESICENYPKPALDCLMNGLGTHDTPRILTVLSGKEYATKRERAEATLDTDSRARAKTKLKAAVLLQCALPGVPCVYYGDEAGLEGYEDPLNRRCYPWGNEDAEIMGWYKTALKARLSNKAFCGGEFKTLRADSGVYIIRRRNKESRSIVAVNMGSEIAVLEIWPGEKVVLSNNAYPSGDKLHVHPNGCAMLCI